MKTIELFYRDANGQSRSAKLSDIVFRDGVIRAKQKIRGALVNRSFLPSDLILDGLKKCVGYSYPTSPNAEHFGFGATGCYYVSLDKAGKPPKAICGFKTRDEAFMLFNLLDCPISKFTLDNNSR